MSHIPLSNLMLQFWTWEAECLSSPSSDSQSSYFPTGKMLSLERSKEGGIRARRTGRRGMGQLSVGKGWLKLWVHSSWHRWTSIHFSNWRMRWALRNWDPTEQGYTVNMFETEWNRENPCMMLIFSYSALHTRFLRTSIWTLSNRDNRNQWLLTRINFW